MDKKELYSMDKPNIRKKIEMFEDLLCEFAGLETLIQDMKKVLINETMTDSEKVIEIKSICEDYNL